MAGIGFILRKLVARNDLLGISEAYVRATVVTAGPWLLTVLTLGLVMLIGKHLVPLQEAYNFQSVIIYNFCFSLVFTSPVSLPATRYLADMIYGKDVSNTPGMLVGTLAFVYLIQIPIAVAFYFLYAKMSFAMALFSVANLLMISTIWMVSIFVTALVNFAAVTRGFLYGMTVSFVLTVIGALNSSTEGMLAGFNVGIAIIIAYLVAEVFAEYPYVFKNPFGFVPSLMKYREVFLSGLIFTSAIWVDKWVMWASPEAITVQNGLVLYPYYDTAAFLSYLVTIPAMALFLINVETDFFEKYVRFYEEIHKGATFKKIVENQQEIRKVLLGQSRTLLILQGTISVLVLFMAPKILEILGVNAIELGIFRFCVVGATYQVMILFSSILIWYFDNRKRVLFLHCVFFITNFLFSWITMRMGFTYYGLGFALSTLLTSGLAAVLMENQVRNLPYYTFIQNNRSINRIPQ